MNDRAFEDWRLLHISSEARKGLAPMLQEAWERSKKSKVDPESCLPGVLSRSDFKAAKRNSRFLYICANGTLEYVAKKLPDPRIGLGLFNIDGCLLKLYGSSDFISWCSNNSITAASVWNEALIGANAVSLGLRTKTSITVKSVEHFSRFALGIGVCFYPIMPEIVSKDNPLLGGVAVLFPADCDASYIQLFTDLVSREINLMSFSHRAYDIYVNVDTSGVVTLDQSTGKNYILLTNDKFNKLFNIEKQNMAYNLIEDVFDPPPKNMQFWEIVNKRLSVEDYPIEISVGSDKFLLNLNSFPYRDAMMNNLSGISFLFDTPNRIRKLISKYVNQSVSFNFGSFIGLHPDFLDVVGYAKSAAASDASILLLGESGVGKDVFAQAIHSGSKRKSGPFVALNCAAFSKELIASELFGYEDGSFTGAKKGGSIGKFELANHGTLFLDEIGDMPLDLQATLLRVLEEQSFMKVGGQRMVNVDVHIIAATNANLFARVQNKLFREDLYYRLSVIRINIPPLRKRGEDVLLLAEYFISTISERINKQPVTLSADAKKYLLEYSWPGNVRELKNLFEGILYINDKDTIGRDLLTRYFHDDSFSESAVSPYIIQESVPVYSREDIIKALQENGNNRTKAAAALHVSRRTFYRRLSEYGLI